MRNSVIRWGLILVCGCFDAAAAQDHIRKRYEHILNWLPADSESLTVLDCPWQIPTDADRKNDKNRIRRPFDVSFQDFHLRHMFNGKQRELLAGKTIKRWISAAKDFHIAPPPVEAEESVVSDSYSLRYTGVHIIEFEPGSGFAASELLTNLLETPAQGLFPAAGKLDVMGHDVVEYPAMHMAENRPRGGRETKATAPLIDTWFSFTFWVASPKPNVLIVATSRTVLEETLKGITAPSPAAFPVESAEWNGIDPRSKVFGIRRFPRPKNASDLSDLRRFGADASAFTFSIDNSQSNAVISIHRANPQARRRVEGILFEHVENTSRKVTSTPDVFQIQLDWKDPEGSQNDRPPDGLAFILLTWLGYAVMI